MISQSLAGLNLLVAEDEYLLADDMSSAAEDRGAHADTAGTVDQAISLLLTGNFDAAILDVNLRGATTEVVAELLAAYDIPALVVTGYDRERLSPRLAALPYLGKPFSSQALGDALEDLVMGSGASGSGSAAPPSRPRELSSAAAGPHAT